MAKRRDPGDGSISSRRRKDGRLSGSFEIGRVNGRRRRKYVYGDTKFEVREKLRLAKLEYERGQIAQSPGPGTLSQWVEQWFKTAKATNQFEESTYHHYRSLMRRYILPPLGEIQLSKLTRDRIQDWINELTEKKSVHGNPLASGTIRVIRNALSSTLQDAYKLGKIGCNPCQGVKLPKAKKYKAQVIDMDQAVKLIKVTRESRLECMLVLTLATGLRGGELRSLRWTDVDFNLSEIRVDRTLAYLPDEQGKYRYVEKTPKSESSVRHMALPQFALAALRAHRIRQQEERLAAGTRWRNLDLVFCTQEGNYYDRYTLRYQFKRLLAEAGLPYMRWHDLRHSAATILIAAGVNVKVVSERLGHASVAFTLDTYGHVLP